MTDFRFRSRLIAQHIVKAKHLALRRWVLGNYPWKDRAGKSIALGQASLQRLRQEVLRLGGNPEKIMEEAEIKAIESYSKVEIRYGL